jgi:hypothetical protein
MIAVLIDADNLPADQAGRILDWCRSKDELLAVRLFGNFAGNRSAQWCEVARLRGLELIFQPNGGAGKNSTDIALTIHAMDLLQEGVATGFCIASNDRDFVPLATRLRRSGRKVFGVGEKLDDRLKSVCHDFLEMRDVPPIVAAYRKVARNNSRMPLSQLAQLLRAHEPQVVPSGAGKLRKTLLESGWLAEEGSGPALTIVLRGPG